ncbi:orotidine 5'-phosphate decarboxylase [Clostridium acetireducens DSM 10703]|uniref:Orotidine 5'-phosphate decarboxylase n=1 Tax=Clostridium acetireducens DSM 10703 TaxID=1121290 RepID=A0A1E8EZW0_9CLOT|nr:orotidine-5'-phosphate decarboxylase [Clostridium acetireducens]OFI06261.1 orotidine 5'-phosphate decarboxylase [Clostridium acetireducens DSM 10703]
MIIDKLYESVNNKGPVCVGLDTAIEYIPKDFLDKYNYTEDAIFRFNQKIIDSTFDVSACYKVQIAYYEALGIKGLIAYKNTLKYIKEIGGIAIADIKRGDISKTAEMYAKAHFEGDFESDFITVNPYMGLDSIEPYEDYVKNNEKGLFILVRTSNKGAKDIQYIDSKSDERIYNIVGEKVQKIGEKYIGNCGYSSIGGVVGCTHLEEGIEIRNNLDKTFFLIPGYGAQGGKADDVAVYFKNGNGGVVNSSRGILLAYKKHENHEKFDLCAREEAISMRDNILKSIK